MMNMYSWFIVIVFKVDCVIICCMIVLNMFVKFVWDSDFIWKKKFNVVVKILIKLNIVIYLIIWFCRSRWIWDCFFRLNGIKRRIRNLFKSVDSFR